FLALQGKGRRRHPPPRHCQFAHAVRRGADDRGGVIGEHAGNGRQIPGEVPHGAGQLADGGLALGDAVEIAHAGEYRPSARIALGLTTTAMYAFAYMMISLWEGVRGYL